MKLFNKTGLLVILALISFRCDTNVLFEGAMPPDVDIITAIPPAYLGTYLCESDSSIIHASEKSIVRESYVHFRTPLKRVRESKECKIKNDSLFFPWSNQCIPFDYINDSTVTATIHKLDTLFQFREGEIAKYYKGRLFLNARIYNSNDWVTSMMTRNQEGVIQWDQLQMPTDIEKVEAITHNFKTKKNRDDETIYYMNPTLVEFDMILEREYVRKCDVFTPIYQPIRKTNYYK